MAKFSFYASKDGGEAGYKLLHKQLAIEGIKPLKGYLKITIEEVESDATDAQIYHFKFVVIPALIYAFKQQGEIISELQAQDYLLSKFANGQSLDNLQSNSKSEMIRLIDESKQLLREFFNIQI